MEPLRIPLLELRRPVEVQLPSGAWHRVQPFSAESLPLLRQYRIETEEVLRAMLLPELLAAALPTATPDELVDTSPEDWARILGAATGKADLMEDILKNGVSGGVDLAPPPTPPSSPTTTTAGPSLASVDGRDGPSPP